MKLKTAWDWVKWAGLLVLSAAVYALGFDLFMEPAHINGGGGTGIAMIIRQLTGQETVFGIGATAFYSLALNVPLFLIGYRALGKHFFVSSLISVALGALMLHLMLPLETVLAGGTDRLLNAVFGGVLLGLSVGLAFLAGSSTGGTVIAARLLKIKFRDFPVGKLTMFVDVLVIIGTGLVYHDLSSTLYSAVSLFASSLVIDAVVYRFDYTKVVLIISEKYEEVSEAIGAQLHRGVTMLKAQGSYKRQDTFVLLSAVKRHQLAELQQLVNGIDENAFVIVQEAHQVLGDGCKHYSEDAL